MNSNFARPGQDTDLKLPSLFSPAHDIFAEVPKENKVEEDPPGLITRMKCFTRTFTLWRPFEQCSRCRKAIENGELLLPEDEGDYTCKHVQNKEYERIINKILAGKGIKQYEEFFTLNDIRCVQLVWLEPDSEFLKELAKNKKIREENKVYPPDPEKVFAEPIKKGGRASTKKSTRPHKTKAGNGQSK